MARTHCPECGAALLANESCYDRFGALIELEYVDTEYGAVHHQAVAAYMLQLSQQAP